MLKTELLDTARIPGGGELRLVTHGGDFKILLDRNELMSSRMSGSEKALATMTLARLAGRKRPHLLIGGYGMGFTLRAALAERADVQITLVELVPEVIAWARGPMAQLAAGCLDDPRVELVMADVGQTIAAADDSYEGILLDVDNGPDGVVRDDNDAIYSARGLDAARAALTPGGVLAVWSAGPDAAFTKRLAQAGFAVEEEIVRARENGKGPRHTIWFARKRA
jgi:spermidine synthase